MNDIEVVVLNKKNISSFAEERNILLQKATKDWVLFVDTDEKLLGVMPTLDTKFNGYKILRKNYFLGQFVGLDKIIRLGRKDYGKWVRCVHEVWDIKGPVGELKDIYLIHNTATSLNNYAKKMNNYSTLHAKANRSEGKTSNLFKIVCYPIFKFITTLFKSKNVTFSIMQSFHSFLSWSKLYFLHS